MQPPRRKKMLGQRSQSIKAIEEWTRCLWIVLMFAVPGISMDAYWSSMNRKSTLRICFVLKYGKMVSKIAHSYSMTGEATSQIQNYHRCTPASIFPFKHPLDSLGLFYCTTTIVMRSRFCDSDPNLPGPLTSLQFGKLCLLKIVCVTITSLSHIPGINPEKAHQKIRLYGIFGS